MQCRNQYGFLFVYAFTRGNATTSFQVCNADQNFEFCFQDDGLRPTDSSICAEFREAIAFEMSLLNSRYEDVMQRCAIIAFALPIISLTIHFCYFLELLNRWAAAQLLQLIPMV